MDFDSRNSCGKDDIWVKVGFVSAVVKSGTNGRSSQSSVIGISTDVGGDNFVSLVDDDADDGSSSPSFCLLNVDDICGEVNSEFYFEWILSYAKHSGHSFPIGYHFPFWVRILSWIKG